MTDSVSIIIPCFNGERTIAATLDSALLQTRPAAEIIVINDGSTDRSRDILDRYEGRVTVVHTPNQGVSAARNRGVEQAVGDWLIFLDADDLLTDDAIAHRLACAQQHDAQVIYTDWQRFQYDHALQVIPGERVTTTIAEVHEDPEIACATQFWAPPVTLMYHRDVVSRIGGWNESLPVIQDARFLFDAASAGFSFAHCEHRTAWYLDDDANSLSRQNQHRFVADVLRNTRQIDDLWMSREVDEHKNRQYRLALASIYDYLARACLRLEQLKDFEQSISRIDSLVGRSEASRWVRLSQRMNRWLGPGLTRRAMKVIGKA